MQVQIRYFDLGLFKFESFPKNHIELIFSKQNKKKFSQPSYYLQQNMERNQNKGISKKGNKKMWKILPFITKALASNDKFLEISRRDELDEDLDPEVEVELRPILVGSRVPLSL